MMARTIIRRTDDLYEYGDYRIYVVRATDRRGWQVTVLDANGDKSWDGTTQARQKNEAARQAATLVDLMESESKKLGTQTNPYVTGQLDRLQRELGKLHCPFATRTVQTRATFLHDDLDALTITLYFDGAAVGSEFQGCDDAVISIVDAVGLGESLDLDGTDVSAQQQLRSRTIHFVRRDATYQQSERASEIIVEWTIDKPQRAANPTERLARRLAAGRC